MAYGGTQPAILLLPAGIKTWYLEQVASHLASGAGRGLLSSTVNTNPLSLSSINDMANIDHDPSVAAFAVSKQAYLQAQEDRFYSLIATSALVLDLSSTRSPRILLVQRAASDSNPNKWEPPGGAVDDDDVTILHAVARELWEETRLKAVRVGRLVGEPHFFNRSNGDLICQFNFAVFVNTGAEGVSTVQLDPNEHQNHVWATEDEVRAGRAGEVDLDFVRQEVKLKVLSAFQQLDKQ